MVVVAVAAMLLSGVTAYRAYRRAFHPTPAEWFRDRAEIHGIPQLAARYRELAAMFERTGEEYDEGCQGPFSDQLEAGQAVLIKQGARATRANPSGRPLEDRESRVMLEDTPGVVLKDWARDADDCHCLREILVQFVDAEQRTTIVLVERVGLRRR